MLSYSKYFKKRELERRKKKIEKHTYKGYRKANSWVPAAFRYKLQEEGRVKVCAGVILGLKYPLAFLGHPTGGTSFDHLEAGSSKSGVQPPTC